MALGGIKMKQKFCALAGAAMACAITPAFAADLSAPEYTGSMKDAPAPVYDIAFGAYSASDYIFRGISNSAREPSISTYSELRYNVSPTIQFYGGSSGESIDFPNHAAAEIDFYGGIRPTFGNLALDVGGWYYWYPGGHNVPGQPGDVSFVEVYGKATYTVNTTLSLGATVNYSPNFLNLNTDGTYATVNAKLNLPANLFPKDIGSYLSGEFGRQWIGSAVVPEYNTWDVGIAFTYKVWTFDFRYYDTDLSPTACSTFTADHFATTGRSSWCGSTFVAKASVDLTANTNLK